MLRAVLLTIHIAAGSVGLVLLTAIFASTKGTPRHQRMGRGFLWCLRVVAVSAIALAIDGFHQLWWFIPIAIFSLGLGEVGKRAWRRPFARAVGQHIGGMGGAAISFVTAVLVVNLGIGFIPAWITPTVVGTLLIVRAANRVRREGISPAGKRRAPTNVVKV